MPRSKARGGDASAWQVGVSLALRLHHPGRYEVVRRLLGHAELSRTLNAYAGFEAGTATRLFGEIVEAGRTA